MRYIIDLIFAILAFFILPVCSLIPVISRGDGLFLLFILFVYMIVMILNVIIQFFYNSYTGERIIRIKIITFIISLFTDFWVIVAKYVDEGLEYGFSKISIFDYFPVSFEELSDVLFYFSLLLSRVIIIHGYIIINRKLHQRIMDKKQRLRSL